MKWYLMVIKKYTVFSGRSRRKEFWMFILFDIIFIIAARILDEMLGLNYSGSGRFGGGYIGLLYSLFILVPSISVTVRRFHDIGKSGWVYFRFMLAAMLGVFIYIFALVYSAIKSGVFKGGFDGFDMETIAQFVIPTLIFILFILVIGVWQLVLLVRDSQPGANKYGPNPKEGEMPVVEHIG